MQSLDVGWYKVHMAWKRFRLVFCSNKNDRICQILLWRWFRLMFVLTRIVEDVLCHNVFRTLSIYYCVTISLHALYLSWIAAFEKQQYCLSPINLGSVCFVQWQLISLYNWGKCFPISYPYPTSFPTLFLFCLVAESMTIPILIVCIALDFPLLISIHLLFFNQEYFLRGFFHQGMKKFVRRRNLICTL